MRIDSSGTLTVGPQYDRLNVNPGSGSYDGDPTSVVIDGRTNDGNTTAFKIDRYDGSGNASTKFFVNYAGNVGIGTTSISSKLDVRGADHVVIGASPQSGNGEGSVFLGCAGTGVKGNIIGRSGITFQTTSSSTPVTSGTERMRIDSSGRLLLGTTTAGSGQLTVASSSHAGITIRAAHAGLNSNISFADAVSGSGADVGFIQYKHSDDTLRISVNNEERMRIDNQGVHRFFSESATTRCLTATSAGTSVDLFFGAHSASSTVSEGTNCFKIFSNGNVQNTNNSYGSISDVKLKENIVDANSQWDDLKAIQVRNYNFKEETGQPTHTQLGIIAQEIETVSPGLVYETPDRDEENNDLGTVTKSVNYSVLYMKAVKALQEAMDRIETLEAEVKALKAG